MRYRGHKHEFTVNSEYINTLHKAGEIILPKSKD